MTEIRANGVRAHVRFDGEVVTVEKRSWLQGRGVRDVPICRVSGIELKPASWFVDGWFTVRLPGAVGPQGWGRPGYRWKAAREDEWTVCFRWKDRHGFDDMRAAILGAIRKRRTGAL